MDLLPHEIEEIIDESIDSVVSSCLNDISGFWHGDFTRDFSQLRQLSEKLAEFSDVNDVEEPDEDASGQEQLDYYVRLGIADANRVIVAAVESFLRSEQRFENEEESLEFFKELVAARDFGPEN